MEKNQIGDFIKSEAVGKRFDIEGIGEVYFNKNEFKVKIKEETGEIKIMHIPYASVEI